MADLAQSPSSSNESPSESGSELGSMKTLPPTPESEGNNSSPPPPDNNSTPPDQSSSSPPPPPQDSNPSPSPPNSNLSPPPKSGSSPPTSSSSPTPPPSNSGSPKSPPPAQSKSASPPPPPPPPSGGTGGGSSPVPPAGNNPPPSSPSKDSSPPSNNPPSTSYPPPPPPASGGSAAFSPPVQTSYPPPSGNSIVILPPTGPGSPPASVATPVTPFDGTPSAPSDPFSSSNPHSDHFTKETPSTESGFSSKSASGPGTGNVAGVALAGVAIVALVAVVFLFLRKRKRKSEAYYIAPPNSFSVKTDGYYYGQQHSAPVPGNSHEYYSGKQSGPGNGNSYGSAGRSYSSGGQDSGVFSTKSSFSYEELMEITNGFSRETILGEGGFGCVYKGRLSDGRVVAVKQLKAGSGQGDREFRAEVEIISRVHHRHLVSLVGYCIAEYQRLLVYEFVPNNTLEYHLHDKGATVLPWLERMKIAIGAARGLAYLHEDCHPRIIHRDIKSANILLDDDFEAQVADFGLAKLTNDTTSHVSTRVMGTFGYMAPEYASSGKLTDRSDVFSYGVMLLELITGRKPVDASRPLGDESLVEWARPLLLKALETGEVSELIDPRLEKKYVESEMFRMIETAAACVRHSAPKRPRMIQVARALDTDGDMPDISNGVKVGQSVVIGTPNTEIHRLQRLAFGSDDASDYDLYSGEFRDVPLRPSPSTRPGESSINVTSGEFESRPMNPRAGSRRL
ncbi:hypothetical protein Sjap_023594 [Stephania japonica]|uniref:non-specific serine/threonine protein kinase n=1 Tax=Stephania japonica TaxID=461633 RepID=A0AAP0HMV0_9MAGN